MLILTRQFYSFIILAFTLASTSVVSAGEVTIVKTVFRASGANWNVDVTLQHKDTGWKHYADAWRVVDAKGNELAKRTLYHPHVNEQPFTRSLSRVTIPKSTSVVYIEAHDTVHKWSPTKLKVDLISNKLSNVQILR